jgi:hypothetical protein
MRLEVIKMIKPFLDFLKSFDALQTYNMMVNNVGSMFQGFVHYEKSSGMQECSYIGF